MCTLQKDYKISTDWDSSLYVGIKLRWNYKMRWLDISMPEYVIEQLTKYKHKCENYKIPLCSLHQDSLEEKRSNL